jgi:hypothetical protein
MQSSTSRVWFVLALFSLSVLVSCDSGGGTPEPDEPSEVNVEVTGTVTSAENDEPIDGASIEILRADNDNTLASATTSGDGSYEATFTIEESETPNQLKVRVSAGRFMDKAVSVDFQSSVSRDVELQTGVVEASVSGVVADTTNDDPIEGAVVTGVRPDSSEQLFEITTSGSGEYEASFEVEATSQPSDIVLSVDADGFESKELTIAFTEEVSRDVKLEAKTTEVTASGLVDRSDTGDPVTNATVTGSPAGNSGQLFETTTNEAGEYEVTFEVRVLDEPDEIAVGVSAEDFEDSEQTVSFGQQITTDFSLQPTTTEVTVSGTVSDSSSSDPIEGATITGTRVDDGDQLFETSAASSGEYESSFTVDAPSAPNELRVEANADSFRAEEATVGFASSVSQDFELVKNRFSLDLSVDGDGSIETNLVSGDLSENGYLLGSEVEVEVIPNGENIFFEWSGGIEGSENPLTIEITENTKAVAEVGTPQERLGLGISYVQFGSTIDEASLFLSNNLTEEVVVTEFTLFDENDQEVINTSENVTIVPDESGGYDIDFGFSGPTPGELEQYETVWRFEFRESVFVKETVVGDVLDLTGSSANSLNKSANMIELEVEE